MNIFRSLGLVVVTLSSSTAAEVDDEWNPRPAFLRNLIESMPAIMKNQNTQTGRFGKEPWICTDQNLIFPLAAAWAIEDKSNPYYRSPELLDAIINGGDALIDAQDEKGMWVFRKKDNSTWGNILMPWTYSRWIRAHQLVRDAMPVDRRERWDRALMLGFDNIHKGCLRKVHNIPTHHAMGLYCAGCVFNREDWKTASQEFMHKVVAHQSPDGWWSEHHGPVVAYNLVYVDALGVYYAMSRDNKVLDALRRATIFHSNFTYPNAHRVAAIDERNPYNPGVTLGNVGFSFSAEGRGFLKHLHRPFINQDLRLNADHVASFLLYGAAGSCTPPPALTGNHEYLTEDGKALVVRRKPWFICISAYTCEQSTSRWVQDRQNFVSVFHDNVGVIVGGGNTKAQPFWSNFTVGDTSLLMHKSGQENPNFIPSPRLIHIPRKVEIHRQPLGLAALYGEVHCRITLRVYDDNHLSLAYEILHCPDMPVEGHMTLIPHLKESMETASGKQIKLTEGETALSSADVGGSIEHAGWRLEIPQGARVLWPKCMHNPYKKDGSSSLNNARIVVALPFSKTTKRYSLSLIVK